MPDSNQQFEPIAKLTDEHFARLHTLYQSEWWTKGRGPEDIRVMVENTDVIVALADRSTGALVAFSRVLTDRIYKALILDMIVDSAHRGRHLGRRLMNDIVSHPELQNVKHFELYCLPEMFPFYRIWGFTAQPEELRLMRLDHRPETE